MMEERFFDMDDDFLNLVDRYLVGQISPEESKKLLAILSANPDRTKTLCENVMVDFWFRKKALILDDERQVPDYLADANQQYAPDLAEQNFDDLVHWEQEVIPRQRQLKPRTLAKHDKPVQTKTKKQPSVTSIVPDRRRMIPLVTAILFLVLLIGMAQYRYLRPDRSVESATFVPFARVIETINARWFDATSSYKKGQEIGRGELALAEGLVKLRFSDGTELVLEGPARFVIAGDKNTFCTQGKISAHVPREGIGFQVTTPLGTVVDRGTDFVIDVSAKKTQVDVVTGLVDLFTTSSVSGLTLEQGEAASIDEASVVRQFDADGDRYISSAIFAMKQETHARQSRDRFRAMADTWSAHPHLLARFDLSGLTGSRTDNLSTKGKQLLAGAKINNCRLTKGFYDGTAAVLFGEKGSFDFELPGAYRNLTLIASVRIDDIKDRTSILMAGHDFYSASGTFLWQILPNGAAQIQLTSVNNRSEQTCFSSEPFTLPCHWKTWSIVAVVLDADKKTISHYYDGRLVAEVPWKVPTPLYIGTASLGNMQRNQFELSPLYLNGAMDDFQIYDKALSSAEIGNIQKVY